MYCLFIQIFVKTNLTRIGQDIFVSPSPFSLFFFKKKKRALTPYYRLLSKLLGEDNQGKPYVRKFTAEAFAFLLRKTRGADLTRIIQCILQSLTQGPSKEYEEGLAMLFFEAIKVDSYFSFKKRSKIDIF